MDAIDFTFHFFSPQVQERYSYLTNIRKLSPNQAIGVVEDKVNKISWPIWHPVLKTKKLHQHGA